MLSQLCISLSCVAALGVLAAVGIEGYSEPSAGEAAQGDHSAYEATSAERKHHVAFFVRGGAPHNTDAAHPVTILVNEAYVVGYCENRKNPLWSAYHVDQTTAKVNGQAAAVDISHDRPDEFYTDVRTAARVDGAMTFGGHYDRGHMTPNNA